MQRSLDFYLATTGDREVHQVFVSGGTGNVQALLKSVERRTRVPVQLLDPLRVADVDRSVDRTSLGERSAQSVVAFGLALRKDKERRT